MAIKNLCMFSPSQHISFDYSSTGAYVLHMLRSEFDVPGLNTDAFDALLDTCENDLAKYCFKPLAGLLAPDDLELWQIDFAEDTVHLAIVPVGQADAFKAYWSEGFLHNPDHALHFKPTLRRIQPAITTSTPRSAKQSLAQDTVRLPAAPQLDIDCPVALLRSPDSEHPDNDSWFDFSTWPPARLQLPSRADDPAFARYWRPRYQRGAHNIWSCREPRQPGAVRGADRFRLAHIWQTNPWLPTWLGGGAALDGQPGKVVWVNDQLVCVTCETDSRGKQWYSVTAVSEHETSIWYSSRKALHIFPVADGRRCLVVDGDADLAMAQGPVSQDDFVRLPKPLYSPDAGVIAPGGDAVVFFTGTKARLRMHRLDLATMAHASCLLKHFGHTGLDRGTRYSTFGSLEVRPGHDDWWILNHKSDQFGTIDIALFWNAATDETFVIEQGDIKLEQPTVLYQRGVGRYLAVQREFVVLLKNFDVLYTAKQKVQLQWESV